MKKLMATLAIAILMTLSTTSTHATPITIGGYDLDTDNFATDILSSSSDTFYTFYASSLESAVLGPDVSSWAGSGYPDSFIELGFNPFTNGAGADIILFETAYVDYLTVEIGGTEMTYLSEWTGEYTRGKKLNAIALDLSDFGISAGTEVESIIVGLDIQGPFRSWPGLAGVATTNSYTSPAPVPEPTTMLLLGSGLIGLVGLRRNVIKY